MDFYRIVSLDDLEEGYKGIREPGTCDGEMLFHAGAGQEKSLMLMPGSVFDRERNRIGYGGGYYDRYLERETGFTVMAVCFDIQVQEKIPSDIHDRKPDMILTECHTYERDREGRTF